MKKDILVIDDSSSWISFHIEKINLIFPNNINRLDFGYSAKDGLRLAKQNKYDLILTDLQMELDFLPKTAGEWFINQIKISETKNKNTDIIIISASYNIETIAKNFNLKYIHKKDAVNNFNVYKKVLSEVIRDHN